ncbi:MAG: ACP S-malonyltransferase [Steroidobacteraceae bacterium]
MFPGQGSQSMGMGGTLFDEFKELTREADEVLGYSIKELCLEDPRQELNKTQFTQPALYVVNALSYAKKVAQTGRKPDYVVGHSLGEFNALLAAECFDFRTGLKLVQKRGQLMGQVSNGGMAAILNASKEEIEATLTRHGLTNLDLANYNTPSQIVISGHAAEIARAQPLFETGTMLYYPLNTSGAFHSRFMQTAKEEFGTFLSLFEFADPKLPVVANVTARPYQSGRIHEALSAQIDSTVRWSESIQYLMARGKSSNDPMEFEEVGHGDVLTRLFETIKRQTTPASLSAYLQEMRPSAFDAPGQRKRTAAEEKVIAWNQQYPIGTKVESTLMGYEQLQTRTEAVVLFGHRAAVYMKGYNGYFDLNEIKPAAAAGK